MPPKGNAWQHTIFVVDLLRLPFVQHWNWLQSKHWQLPFPAVPVAHKEVSMCRFSSVGWCNKIVGAACVTLATTKKQTYRTWCESQKDMALHVAYEKGCDSRVVSTKK